MDLSPRALLGYARSDLGKTTIRYATVSAIAIVVSQVTLVVCFGFLDWSARAANVTSVITSTPPSYYLNRKWVWGKSGKSHMWREVVPFWALAVFGLLFSTWAAHLGEKWGESHVTGKGAQTIVVSFFSLASYGILWVGKFVLFHKVLFAHKSHEPAPA